MAVGSATSGVSGINSTYAKEAHAVNKVHGFLEHSKVLVGDILEQKRENSSGSNVHHVIHHYNGPGPAWGNSWVPFAGQGSNNGSSSSTSSSSNSGKKDHTLAVIALAGGALYSLYQGFKSKGEYDDAKDALKYTADFERQYPSFSNVLEPKGDRYFHILTKASEIIPIKNELCERIKNSAFWRMTFSGTALTGIAAAGTGIYLDAVQQEHEMGEQLMLAGVTIAVTSLAIALMKSVYDSFRRVEVRQAKQIQEILNRPDPAAESIAAESAAADLALKNLAIQGAGIDIKAKKVALNKATLDLKTQKEAKAKAAADEVAAQKAAQAKAAALAAANEKKLAAQKALFEAQKAAAEAEARVKEFDLANNAATPAA